MLLCAAASLLSGKSNPPSEAVCAFVPVSFSKGKIHDAMKRSYKPGLWSALKAHGWETAQVAARDAIQHGCDVHWFTSSRPPRLGTNVSVLQNASRYFKLGFPYLEELIWTSYRPALGLSKSGATDLVEYMRAFEPVRRCCGAQASEPYRKELAGRAPGSPPGSHFCFTQNVTALEQQLITTTLGSRDPSLRIELAVPPEHVAYHRLDGGYCAWMEGWQRRGLDRSNSIPFGKVFRLPKERYAHDGFGTAARGTTLSRKDLTSRLMRIYPYSSCACPSHSCFEENFAFARGKKLSLGAPHKSFLTCGEGVPACSGRVPVLPFEGSEIAVLSDNSVYRLNDILLKTGTRWRLDSFTILCEERYRNSLLRLVLMKALTFPPSDEGSGVGVESGAGADADQAFEQRVAAALHEPLPGFAKWTHRGGPGELQLANSTQLLETLASELRRRHEAGECDGAQEGELVVSLRLGDLNSIAASVVHVVREYVRKHPGKVQAVVLMAVLHYGANTVSSKELLWMRSKETDTKSIDVLREVVAGVRALGLPVRVRSESDADKDLCFLCFSDRVAPSPKVLGGHHHGLPVLLGKLHHLLGKV
mmetsp:Transcript_47458/g.122627  ORF Transcript_47458/g.122627 Transcript_47458/m.122627 type:complete len:591 (+) Transcript_47458:339-2111(+)